MTKNMQFLYNIISEIIDTYFGDELPTLAQIDEKADEFRELLSKKYPVSDDEFKQLKQKLASEKLHKIEGETVTLRGHDAEHQSWYFSEENDDLKTIKSVGNIIAKVSVINSSLFYKLDKVRSIDDFWGVLREISRKLVNTNIDKSMIREKALDELIVLLKSNEDDWKEIRDLLIVYAAMYYSIGSRDGEEDGN